MAESGEIRYKDSKACPWNRKHSKYICADGTMVYVRSAEPDVSGTDAAKTASKGKVLYGHGAGLEQDKLGVLNSGTQYDRDMEQIVKC